jgi:4-hydroxy-3-methylbut-2-enyl diphosphate reductase IspH
VFDAICPLVTKVHMEVGLYQKEGRECILIGHAGHPEVEGTLGQYKKIRKWSRRNVSGRVCSRCLELSSKAT